MIIPDKFARTVKLNIRVSNGKMLLADGGELPELEDGAYGELIVFASAVIDDKVRNDLTNERVVSFLPSREKLWAKIRDEKIPESLTKFRENRRTWQGEPGLFVPFVLCAELQIIMRGTKFASLRDCPCDVSALVRKAESINQAYTLISTAFEPTRRSHTGNVFQKVFAERDSRLRSLDELRMVTESNPPPEVKPVIDIFDNELPSI
jgi:hypothetical protein